MAVFVAICLALLGVKLILGAQADPDPAPSTAPLAQAPKALAPVPTTGPFAHVWSATPAAPAHFNDPHTVHPKAGVARALSSATTLTTWPFVSNAYRVGTVGDLLKACDDVDNVTPQCVVQPSTGIDPKKVAVLVGDTTMESYWFMLRDALLPRGWTLVGFSLTGCPGAMYEPSPSATCARHHAAYEKVLDRWKPSLALFADAESAPVDRSSYAAGLTHAVRLTMKHTRSVVLLSPPPAQPSLSTCQSAGKGPAQCQQPPYPTWFALNAVDRTVASRTGATYADLLPYFCHELACPSIVAPGGIGTAIRGDFFAMTPEYAQTLAPSFARYLLRERLIR